MNLSFETVDVFSATRFAGNPLAVVPDARGLTKEQMQTIAREFNYAETSFVLPPQDPANSAHVRIFTPEEEMPFAGHPNVGTAFILGQKAELWGRKIVQAFRFEEIAGIVHVCLLREGNRVTGASVRAPCALSTAEGPGTAMSAGLAGLDALDIRITTHSPIFASVGAEFLFAEVSAEALARAGGRRESFAALSAALAKPFLCIYLYARCGNLVDARLFAPLSGVPEDPATGSAAAALGALLSERAGITTLSITQGVAMGRRSEILVETGVNGTWISGDCVAMMRGELLL